jgi:aldehyde dehydrogenase (NAD+)
MAISMLGHRDEVGLADGQLLVDGEWRAGSDGETWTHVHPASGEEIGRFAVASASDVDAAVRAARRAFEQPSWSRGPVRQRIRLLRRISEAIVADADRLARLQALDNGVPLSFGAIYPMSMDFCADIFDHHAGWIDKLGGETLPPYTGGDHMVLTLRQPVGVVGAILPWNAPVWLFAQKVAPALATGCTVVLKPSEYATFAVLRLAELVMEAGAPPGVLNIVTGPGPSTGEALITHPEVDKLTFTGSRGVGRRIMEAAGDGIRRVSLELGGKSPSIVFPDAPDLARAAMTAMGMVTMGMSGQGCVCHTRLLAHRSVYDELLDGAVTMAGAVQYGDPFDPATTSAPIINQRQLERITGLIDRAASSSRLVVGGDRPEGDLSNGNWVNPTLFADVDASSEIAQEEVFGPVLSVTPFEDEDEAIRLANDTRYGLGASVYTTDLNRAMRVARAVKAGTFGVNGYTVAPNAPFGGFKQSGLGREGGREGIEAFTELKTVWLALEPIL